MSTLVWACQARHPIPPAAFLLPLMGSTDPCSISLKPHTLALQQHGGRLPVDQARVALAGLGPALPLPRMHGMASFPGGKSYSPQPTGGAPVAHAPAMYAPQAAGGSSFSGAPPAYAAASFSSQTASAPVAAAGGSTNTTASYAPQFTGAGYQPQTTGVWGCGLAGHA